MIKAIYRDGVIQPVDPVPLDWPEGQELQIQRLQASSADVELRRQFESLSGQWKQESRYLSSTTDISTNPAYQRIIGMGMPVVPLILEDLRKQPYPWFWALSVIVGTTSLSIGLLVSAQNQLIAAAFVIVFAQS
jgi:predicted DNA-binding antitoxin AbrB/MazE fold protein